MTHYNPADETIPAQPVTDAPAITVRVDVMSDAQARIERLEAVIWGYEGTLRAIRQRAQKGMLETQAVRAAMQLETIDVLAALALMGGVSQEYHNEDRGTIYDEP